MLSHEQLCHFAEHGWVLQADVLAPDQCAAYRRALDQLVQDLPKNPKDTVDITNVEVMVNYDRIFRDWITIPHVLQANRQLMGCEIKYECCHAMVKIPHPDRAADAEALRRPDKMGWHRGLRPKWGTFAHDTDPALINCTFLNNITYLTDVAPSDGGTMVLDGSHRLEGDYHSLKSRCPIVELTAAAGSILHFTESLIHTGVPILSEQTRYTMFYGFTPSWYVTWPNCAVAPEVIAAERNDELRAILGERCGYVGQNPVAS